MSGETMPSHTVTLDDLNEREIRKLVAPIIYLSISMVIGIFGNLTVLIIYRRKYKKSVYRTIIWNLALTDFLFCTLTMPFNIGRLIRYYTFYNLWACKTFTTVIVFFIMYSSHLLVTLGIHRFKQVCLPMKGQISPLSVWYWIIGSFCLAVFLNIPQVILQPIDKVNLENNITGYVCAVSFHSNIFAEVYNGFLTFLFGFYALLLFALYILIGRRMYQQNSLRVNIMKYSKSDELSSKITKIAVTVSVVFALSYIPLFLLKVLVGVINEAKMSSAEFAVFKIMERSYVVNHVANPFIYAFYDNRFRSEFKMLLTTPWRLKELEGSSVEERTASLDKTLDTNMTSVL